MVIINKNLLLLCLYGTIYSNIRHLLWLCLYMYMELHILYFKENMICQYSNRGFKYVIKFKLNQKYIFNNDVFWDIVRAPQGIVSVIEHV